MKLVKEFDFEKLKEYEFKMYEKRYREWETDKCFYKDTNNQKIMINPDNLGLNILEADYMI